MDTAQYVRYAEVPQRRQTRMKYDWPGHAEYLRQHPNEWVRLEEEVGVGAVNEVKRGNQADMARLIPHLHLITRNTRIAPDGRRVAALIAKYTPGVRVVSARRTLSDEQVRAARFTFARGEKNGRELAREYDVQPGSMYTLLYGVSRQDAGGPYGRTEDERMQMLIRLEAQGQG